MKRIEKSSSRRPSKEKEQATKIKEKKKRRDRREKVVARRDDDETAVAKRAGARVLLGLVFLNSGKKRMESVIRDFNAAINIRRFAVLKTRPQELTRAIFVEQPLRLKVYKEKLKLIAGGRSKKSCEPSEVAHIHSHSRIAKRFASTEHISGCKFSGRNCSSSSAVSSRRMLVAGLKS
jgi:adenine-specific DNA glycosylase